MKLKDRTVLITGGSSGIGKGLAEVFYRLGSQVVVTGRQAEPLQALCEAHPGMAWFTMDVSDPESVRAAAKKAAAEFPRLDCLINNAGIQHRVDFSQEEMPALEELSQEVNVNLNGLIWMTSAFLPLLRQNSPASIINVSSGLGFVPIAKMPIYCATKAAVHSFTQSLRHQLKPGGIEVIELVPPAVETRLDDGKREQNIPFQLTVAAFIDSTLQALQTDDVEIFIGAADHLRQNLQKDPNAAFSQMNPERVLI
ncbi:MAG: SDR family oxidoreductase [Candidatus Sericytochromatia bacterium]